MFTRWGEAKTGQALPEPLLAEAARIHGTPMPSSAPYVAPPGPELRTFETNGSGPPPPPPRLGQVVPASVRIGDDAAAAGLHHSVIGADLAIEGQSITIRCKGALEVNGSIQAELHSKTLVVGQSGKVEGAVWADTIDVRGKVCGTIKGNRVILHPSADVEGDIHAASLSVSDGATFEGRSRRATDPASVAPQLDGSTPATNPTGEPPPLPSASPVRPASIGG